MIGDVGQNLYEEIDVGLADNYGWPCREALHAYGTDAGCAPPAVLASPVLEHAHSEGFCAIVGGYVVRDPGLPTLLGRYLYGDNCSLPLRVVDLADPTTDTTLGLTVSRTKSFGEDGCGRILVVSLNGPVSRLVDGALRPCGTDTEPEPTPTPTPTPTDEPTPAATVAPAPTVAPTPPPRAHGGPARVQAQRPRGRRPPSAALAVVAPPTRRVARPCAPPGSGRSAPTCGPAAGAS